MGPQIYTLGDGTPVEVSKEAIRAFDRALREVAPDHFDYGLPLGEPLYSLRFLIKALLEKVQIGESV